jgi:hypothetical protein
MRVPPPMNLQQLGLHVWETMGQFTLPEFAPEQTIERKTLYLSGFYAAARIGPMNEEVRAATLDQIKQRLAQMWEGWDERQRDSYLHDPKTRLVFHPIAMNHGLPELMARFIVNHWDEYLASLSPDPSEILVKQMIHQFNSEAYRQFDAMIREQADTAFTPSIPKNSLH